MKLALILVLISAATFSSGADSSSLAGWIKLSHSPAGRELLVWLKQSAGCIMNGVGAGPALQADLPELSGRAGMFITLVRKGKVRGCYGSFHHEPASTREIFLRYLKGALFMDPRYRPIEPAELDDTEIIVTVTSYPEPVDDPDNIDITGYGVFIECEGLSGTVIVPAEFRTVSGITARAGGTDCRYSEFRAVTIE